MKPHGPDLPLTASRGFLCQALGQFSRDSRVGVLTLRTGPDLRQDLRLPCRYWCGPWSSLTAVPVRRGHEDTERDSGTTPRGHRDNWDTCSPGGRPRDAAHPADTSIADLCPPDCEKPLFRHSGRPLWGFVVMAAPASEFHLSLSHTPHV